jgi:hypothetical protein
VIITKELTDTCTPKVIRCVGHYNLEDRAALGEERRPWFEDESMKLRGTHVGRTLTGTPQISSSNLK